MKSNKHEPIDFAFFGLNIQGINKKFDILKLNFCRKICKLYKITKKTQKINVKWKNKLKNIGFYFKAKFLCFTKKLIYYSKA